MQGYTSLFMHGEHRDTYKYCEFTGRTLDQTLAMPNFNLNNAQAEVNVG